MKTIKLYDKVTKYYIGTIEASYADITKLEQDFIIKQDGINKNKQGEFLPPFFIAVIVKFLTRSEIVKLLTLTIEMRLLRNSQKPFICPFKRVYAVSVGIYQRRKYRL